MADTNDIVLIYIEDQPFSFARIEDIQADHKPDWYHVRLLLLQIPLQVVTWILRNAYINGDSFTMGGKQMRLERVEAPTAPDPAQDEDDSDPPPQRQAKVISLKDLKK